MILATLTALATFAPQGLESDGPMVGVPHATSVATGTLGGTTALSNAEIWFKLPGIEIGPPVSGVPAGRPDFRIASMLKGLTTLPDVASMSIGLDWILSDDNGRVAIPTGGFGMLSLSFTRGTLGNGAMRLGAEVAWDGASADIYSYIVPGSNVPPAIIDVLQRGQNHDEIAYAGTAKDIDGHDVFLGGYQLDAAVVAMLPADPTFYFTVSKATLSRIPVSTGWWGPPSSSPTPSGATILMTRWNPTTRVWSTPSVFLDYKALGFLATEEIDALAVDPIRGRLMLSTKTASRNPILVAIPTTTGIKLKTYVLQDGKTTVSSRLGMLQTDDVDAICALDPNRGHGARFLQHCLGIPQQGRLIPQLPSHGSASVFRRGPQDEIETWLTGWPRNKNPRQSIAILAFTFPTIPLSPMIVVGGVVKNPNRWRGGPVKFQPPLRIPRQFSLRGPPIHFNWIMAERNNRQVVTMPYPVRITL